MKDTYKVAIYPGSFNPFHKGHYNILQKAEAIFDKVIIGVGQNPEKSKTDIIPLPDIIHDRDIRYFNGLLTDFIDSIGMDVTVIRGLRNSTDLQFELTQYRFLQELKPNIKLVSIFCDSEFEHISSSAIRILKQFGKESNYIFK